MENPDSKGYCLVWADEFSGTTIDSLRWSHERNCFGGGNDEAQCYVDSSENSWVSDGLLHIKAIREDIVGPALMDDHPNYDASDISGTGTFSSARIRSVNKGDWKYGRFEIRVKMPMGQGTWPAVWMLPTAWTYGGWPSSGEIDIVEAVNLKVGGEDRVHATLHFGDVWPGNAKEGTEFRLPGGVNPADGFHTYALEWEQGEIRWYVDDQHYATQTSEGWYSAAALEDTHAPFDQEFHLIMNLAVGGNWAGNVNATGVDETVFPQEMQVDYVRVYQCTKDRDSGRGCASRDSGVETLPGELPPADPQPPGDGGSDPDPDPQPDPEDPSGGDSDSTVLPLTVEGSKILIGGEGKSLAGNSLFWSNNFWGGEKYYNAETIAWLKSDWKATVVRAAMGVEDPGGYLDDQSGNEAKVRAVVDAAIANDLYVIIDWHSHRAHEHDWTDAINFFKRMATDYGDHENVIYEIYNEPLQVSWSNQIKPYAQALVAAIREIDPDNLIVVGTPTWSQDVDVASRDPILGYDNIAYTLHFYAGTHGEFLRDKARTAMNNGIALFVTEWGTVNANGDGTVDAEETKAWMDFLKANGISHANWAINDKDEGASALKPGSALTGNWQESSLTESGTLVRGIVRNW
ncbi:cellulase family glycosylhydrolase [Microbulbifer agarilyticus]